MEPMDTVSEVIAHLRDKGYTADFNLKESYLECTGDYLKLHPNEFIIDKHYRFEGTSDPGDEAIVYAISSAQHGIKGILVNSYGVYSDPLTDEMVEALKEKEV
ncbi:phosphoribosylpyrophosphate synthetase [Mucilaginibacter pallidiroseus]|uniref:Phosphoribosylpyrophosphate synthetase n=1 Tax=Mucilaginibacter pallidiroseus TaxID=2599295 RepID=A0A563U8E7_9SPHI|nr:phosphoribosylpyrophosphate synthetase [Mucilaginibacter pallidiroseus]TWR27559.1 phosphoribosylpyrophosphate synthetase [Mucilaginibacter pallidiroseus]